VDGEHYRVGSCAHSDMTIFSFHPVKHMTTGEGGMITTNSEELYRKLLRLRTHGITKEPSELEREEGPWYYEMQTLGFNYRITDMQCALGLSQLKKLDRFVQRRREIVETYNRSFSGCGELILPGVREGVDPSWHLYVIRLRSLDRLGFFNALRGAGLGVNVHYIPVHLQPYYRERFGYAQGDFPASEAYYEKALTLPLYPDMADGDVERVVDTALTTLHELTP
jgi:dTDP-4-amino-4,6-dideoxygalactose transaminase